MIFLAGLLTGTFITLAVVGLIFTLSVFRVDQDYLLNPIEEEEDEWLQS